MAAECSLRAKLLAEPRQNSSSVGKRRTARASDARRAARSLTGGHTKTYIEQRVKESSANLARLLL
jgi:hypothetical protein